MTHSFLSKHVFDLHQLQRRKPLERTGFFSIDPALTGLSKLVSRSNIKPTAQLPTAAGCCWWLYLPGCRQVGEVTANHLHPGGEPRESSPHSAEIPCERETTVFGTGCLARVLLDILVSITSFCSPTLPRSAPTPVPGRRGSGGYRSICEAYLGV